VFLAQLTGGDGDRLAIRRPGWGDHVGGRSRYGYEKTFPCAVGVGGMNFGDDLPRDATKEHKLFAVRRERNRCIDVANELTRAATENWHYIEVPEIRGAGVRADEINVIAVLRKSETGERLDR